MLGLRWPDAREWAGVQVTCFLLTAVLLNTGLTTMTGGIPTHQDGSAINTTSTSGVPKYNSTCLEDLDSNNSPFLNLQTRGYVLVGPLLLAMWTCAKFKKSVSTRGQTPTRPMWKRNVNDKMTYSPIGILFYSVHIVNAIFVIGFVWMFNGIEGKWKMPNSTVSNSTMPNSTVSNSTMPNSTVSNSTQKYASACLYNGKEADFDLVIRPEVFMIFAVSSWAVGLFAFFFMDDDAIDTRNLASTGVRAAKAAKAVVVDWQKRLRGFCNLVIFCCTAWTVFSNFDAKTSCGLRNQALYLGVLLYPTAFGMIWGLFFDYGKDPVFRPSRISLMLVASAIITQTYISRVRPCDNASPGVKDAIPLVNAGAIFVWMAYEAIGIFRDFPTEGSDSAPERTSLVSKRGVAGRGSGQSATALTPPGGDMVTLRLTSDGGKPNPSGSLQFV